MATRWDQPFTVTQIGGKCPCQAEGVFYGFPFYFRARHGSWTLDVVLPGDDPVCAAGPVYHADGDDPEEGWMEPWTALAILAEHWKRFVEQEIHLAGYAYEVRPLSEILRRPESMS